MHTIRRVTVCLAFLLGLFLCTELMAKCPTLLNHSLKSIEGKNVNLCDYLGKVIVAVNTASECGYTPQYKELEELYQKYKDRGVVILGFPANDFGGQEPGSDADVKSFCERRYGVTFPLFSKTSVIQSGQQGVMGKMANFLMKKKSDETESYNPFFGSLVDSTGKPPKWNFNKYIVDRKGETVKHFGSGVKPTSKELTAYVESLL